jgi:hypothetical protein
MALRRDAAPAASKPVARDVLGSRELVLNVLVTRPQR